MKKSIVKTISICTAICLITIIIFSTSVFSYSEDSLLKPYAIFYIRNVNSGQYLDVDHAIYEDNTNVLQWPYNGQPQQQWQLYPYGDGTYMLVSQVASQIKVLTITPSDGANGSNAVIYHTKGNTSCEFALQKTGNGSYIIRSKSSGFNSGLAVSEASCVDGANVLQWQYNGSHNDEWILEPASYFSEDLGILYAISNYYKRSTGFPNCSPLGGDCANFVSQCMLASGVDHKDEWWIRKKNNAYLAPSSAAELDYSWLLTDPSPWISAKEFNAFWYNRVSTEIFSSKEIKNNKEAIFNKPFFKGDVIQILDVDFMGALNAKHTMYITDYGDYDGSISFMLTYHSTDTYKKNLIELCNQYPSSYFRFFSMH